MTIYRGPGGTGSATSDIDTTEFQEFLVQSEAARDAAVVAQLAAETAELNAETAAAGVDAGVLAAAASASSAATSASASASSASSASSSASAADLSASQAAASAASIDPATLVKVTGNQTIAGTKTFSSSIVGSITGTASNVIGTINVGNGGTSATTASSARTNLGVAIGTDVQAYSANLTSYAATGVSFRNRIINGDMRIDQRNAGASVTPTASSMTIDRWAANISVTSKISVQQRDARTSTASNYEAGAAPTGFKFSLKITSLSAYSIVATDLFAVSQKVEGSNVSDLGWGTADAQPVTLSFWVRSSLTGAFGGVVQNGATNRSYPFTYSINVANTWEKKTITVAGDTTGTWATDNGIGMWMFFGLGVGSAYSGTANAWAAATLYSTTGATSLVGTNGATFYVTGVQLEAGSVATPFERRDYGRELIMCQRYYQKTYDLGVAPGSVTSVGATLFFTMPSGNAYHTRVTPVELRSTPTVVFYSTDGTVGTARDVGASLNRAMTPGGETSQKQVVFAAGGFSTSNAILGHFTAASEP